MYGEMSDLGHFQTSSCFQSMSALPLETDIPAPPGNVSLGPETTAGWRRLPSIASIRAACPPEADGVLIGGTGFRCVAILETLEQDLARPVISANQASLWHCLRLSGVKAPVAGYGNLLRI